jgi:hypothetical protein
MKKLFGIFFAILFVACSSKKDSIAFNDSFEDKENNITLTFECNLNVSHPQLSSQNSKALRDSIIATTFGDKLAKYNNKKVLKKYAKSSLATFVESTDSTLTDIKLYTKIDGEIVYADDTYVTFRRIMSTNTTTNAQTLMTTCNYYVFDAKTGRNLSEKDIFTPQQMNAMRSLLVNRAKEMAAQNEININTRRVRPNGNFAIFDSTIVYTFNPYEIAHPRIGFIEIALEGKEEILSIK